MSPMFAAAWRMLSLMLCPPRIGVLVRIPMTPLGMDTVLLWSHPLKIFDSVVHLYTVLVVGFFSRLPWSEKCRQHHTMHGHAT